MGFQPSSDALFVVTVPDITGHEDDLIILLEFAQADAAVFKSLKLLFVPVSSEDLSDQFFSSELGLSILSFLNVLIPEEIGDAEH